MQYSNCFEKMIILSLTDESLTAHCRGGMSWGKWEEGQVSIMVLALNK